MQNPYFNYDGRELWERSSWTDREPVMLPLLEWLAEYNEAHMSREMASGKYDGRTDGEFNPKTGAYTYAEIPAEWQARGMRYRCDEIGGAKWIALMPEELLNGGSGDIPLLVTLSAAPADCPNWAANVMEYRRPWNEWAVAERAVVLHIVLHAPSAASLTGLVVQERAVDLGLSMNQVLLDVSPLQAAGIAPEDIPGFVYRDKDGNVQKPEITAAGNFPVLDIAGRLNSSVSFWVTSSDNPHYHHKGFDLQRLHSDACGEAALRGIRLERTYLHDEVPGYREMWDRMGVAYATHETAGQQWLALAPKAIRDADCPELPVVCIFQETTKIYPFQNIMAVSVWYDYAMLAAQGECIVLMFALETPDANDLWIDILHEAERLYPVDRSRVYFTGHSHNGMFAAEFVRRHHREITAIAPCGNHFGIPHPDYSPELVMVDDAAVADMASYDMPTVMINGFGENTYYWNETGSIAAENDIDAFHRRLQAERCPDKSSEEIRNAKQSADRVERTLGLPCDATRIQYLYGRECFIGDFVNREGRNHFRTIILEDMVHMSAPQMPLLSWDFLRRFRRDPETGLISEI